MKKIFVSFLFMITMISSFGQPLVDRGYLNLDGPSIWNDSYVTYNLITSNEKGGKARTTFEDDSYNKILELFEYDSKDWFALQNESENLREDKVGGFLNFDDIFDNFEDMLDFITDLTDLKDFEEDYLDKNENVVNLIEEKCNLFKKQLMDSYISTKENFQKLSPEEKAILRKEAFNGTSGVTVKFSRYVDSRSGYFTFKIFQKELSETNYFRVSDSTSVYFDVVDSDHLKNYSNLDEKALAICSELSINKEIIFGVLKEEVLKPYKNCGFILIRSLKK